MYIEISFLIKFIILRIDNNIVQLFKIEINQIKNG